MTCRLALATLLGGWLALAAPAAAMVIVPPHPTDIEMSDLFNPTARIDTHLIEDRTKP